MRKMRWAVVIVGAMFGLQQVITVAADWPGYRGANQDGISTEKLNWGSGPKVVWKVPINKGLSSFAVAGGKAFTQVVQNIDGSPREVCLALDAATGKQAWTADLALGKGYSGATVKDEDGPRSTPTISDGMVYCLTPELVAYGLDEKTGKTVWKRDIMKDHAGHNIQWRSAASVPVDGDLVFVAGGGDGQAMLGLNKKSGEVVWKTGSETITHSTPVVATILGTRQVIFFLKSGLVSVDVKNGKELWRFAFPFSTSTAISPVVENDIVYCSAGYGVGSAACRISKSGDKFKAAQLWKSPGNKPVANHWSTPVVKDGYLYGMFGFKEFKTEPLKCVELATGKVKWEKSGFGQGNVILVGDKLLALSETGELVAAEASPTAYKEVGRTQAIRGLCWSTPAFSDGRVYVRSGREGACLDFGK